jgi:hypothetical protein
MVVEMNLILKAMLCPLPTNADWRAEARKIVVLITDPTPHGIGEDGDEFPEGCHLVNYTLALQS